MYQVSSTRIQPSITSPLLFPISTPNTPSWSFPWPLTQKSSAKMSDMKASVEPTTKGFSVTGYEKIEYDFEFLDNVFDPANTQLAECYARWKRCLAVMDMNMYGLYGPQLQRYMDHHGIELKVHQTMVGEKAKGMDTLLGIVDSMNEFGVYRKEAVLVVGGGLVTDVAG